MNKKQLVLARLKSKPNVKPLGFDKKELMGIAAQIADNLTSEEDASEEELNAEIDKAIDAVVPFLQMAQSQANRVIESFKKKQEPNDDDDDDDPDDKNPHQNRKKQDQPKKDDSNSELKQLMEMVTQLRGELASFKGEKVADMRKQKLEALLKDTGAFGSRTLKSFNKMTFETDAEFDEFYSEVESDLKDYNQERTSAGLSSLGSLPGVPPKKVKEEPFSDEEIAALAED